MRERASADFNAAVVDALPFLVDPLGLPGLPVLVVGAPPFAAPPTPGGVNPVVVLAIFCINCCPKFAKFGLLPPYGFCINPSMFPGVIPGTPVVPPFAIPDWKNIVLNISNDATFGIPFGGCSADPPTFVLFVFIIISVGLKFVKSCPDPLCVIPPQPPEGVLFPCAIIACACA